MDDVDTDKILIFNKVSFGKYGFKYFIGYKHNEEVKSLCMKLNTFLL